LSRKIALDGRTPFSQFRAAVKMDAVGIAECVPGGTTISGRARQSWLRSAQRGEGLYLCAAHTRPALGVATEIITCGSDSWATLGLDQAFLS